MGRGTARAVTLAALAASLSAAAVALGAVDDTILVSREDGANGDRTNGAIPKVSADGNRVVYASGGQVMLRDVAAGTTETVSRATGAGGAVSNGDNFNHDISNDGRYVVWESDATNLSTEDVDDDGMGNDIRDVFVRDLQADTTELVSRESGADADPGTRDSLNPYISGNGRYVTFGSRSPDFSDDDDDTVFNSYVRDLQEDTTTLYGRANGTSGAGANESASPGPLSDDGRLALFFSDATNLPGNGAAGFNAWLRDLDAGTTTLLSATTGGDPVSTVFGGDISGDGSTAYFVSPTNDVTPDDPDGQQDLFIRRIDTDTTTFESRASDGTPANGYTEFVAGLSGDGRYVAFASAGANLSTEDVDTGNMTDVFVRDLQEGDTAFVSRASGATGEAGNAASRQPHLSANGRFVAFDSNATNLTDEGSDGLQQVYRRELLAGDDGGGGGDEADLAIGIADDPDPVEIDSALTYLLTVANQGPDAGTGVRVADDLPAGVDLIGAESSQGSCAGNDDIVQCDLGTMASGAEESVVITVRPREAGEIENGAAVAGNRSDPDTSDNAAVETTVVEPIDTDTRVGTSGGNLPFTGLTLGPMIWTAALMIALGILIALAPRIRGRLSLPPTIN